MKKNNSSKNSATNWTKIDALRDEEIDLSDIPAVTPEMFARGIVRHGLKPVAKKSQLTLRVDQDVLSWFRSQGRGYQTRINSLLRAYMDAHQQNRVPKDTLRSSRTR